MGMTIYNIITFTGAAMIGAGFLLIILLIGLMIHMDIDNQDYD